MRVLLTGASGLLGSELLREINDRAHSVTSLDRNKYFNCSASVKSSFLSGYDTIIHAAANTNVEQCELYPEACFRDNCFLTEDLFRQAQRSGVKFVYVSSTGVYGRGKNTPFHEYDFATPTTVHHHAKYMAERIVLSAANSLVIRTGWLFGGSLTNPKNFVFNRINEARIAVGAMHSNRSQTGSPTYVVDCARQLLDLLDDDCSGVYNIVNSHTATRLEYVQHIVELAGSSIDVLPIDSSGFKRHANVSENESAISYRMRFEGRAPLRPWRDALIEYMRDYALLGSLAADNKPS